MLLFSVHESEASTRKFAYTFVSTCAFSFFVLNPMFLLVYVASSMFLFPALGRLVHRLPVAVTVDNTMTALQLSTGLGHFAEQFFVSLQHAAAAASGVSPQLSTFVFSESLTSEPWGL